MSSLCQRIPLPSVPRVLCAIALNAIIAFGVLLSRLTTFSALCPGTKVLGPLSGQPYASPWIILILFGNMIFFFACSRPISKVEKVSGIIYYLELEPPQSGISMTSEVPSPIASGCSSTGFGVPHCLLDLTTKLDSPVLWSYLQ